MRIDTEELEAHLEIRNKEVVESMLRAIARDGFAAQAEYFADEVLNHGRLVPREAVRGVLSDIEGTFPDVRFEPLTLVAEADWVVLRCAFVGTHEGTGRHPFVHEGLLAGVEPTNRRVSAQHIHMFRLAGGKIVEHWACRDDVAMMRQLGFDVASPRTGSEVRR